MGKGLSPTKYSFQAFNFLIFPLDEVKNYKNKKIMITIDKNKSININQFKNMNQILQINQVTIYDCFEYFQKEESLVMWCNECKALLPSKKQKFIYNGSNILIIILNRGEMEVKLDYYESIDLKNFILKKDRISMIYDLYGVVTYLKGSGDKGHYVASCKSPCNNKWYRYNDKIVTPIMDMQKEIIDFENSYILFYQKR